MVFRHPTLRRLFAAVACVLWMAGGLESAAHDVIHPHVYCAEHGVVEHAKEVKKLPATVDGPSIRAQDDAHGDACPSQMLRSAAVVFRAPLLIGIPQVGFPDQAIPIQVVSPRGPPLVYAPKTSPPKLC